MSSYSEPGPRARCLGGAGECVIELKKTKHSFIHSFILCWEREVIGTQHKTKEDAELQA